MTKINIETKNRGLILDIWQLKADGIEIEQPMTKASPDAMAEMAIYISSASLLLQFISALLSVIKRHEGAKPSPTKTIIYTTVNINGLPELISGHQNISHVNVNDEHEGGHVQGNQDPDNFA